MSEHADAGSRSESMTCLHEGRKEAGHEHMKSVADFINLLKRVSTLAMSFQGTGLNIALVCAKETVRQQQHDRHMSGNPWRPSLSLPDSLLHRIMQWMDAIL